MIIARKGEEIIDYDGRLFATLRRDVEFGEIVRLSMFDFAGDQPKAGDLMPRFLVEWVARKAII